MENIIAELPKNSKEKIVAAATSYKGYDLLAVRIYALKDDGRWVPSKKGLTLRLDSWRELLPALQSAIVAEAHEMDG